MHCLSHSLRASVEALSQFHDSLAIAAAVLFTAVMAFAAVQTSRGNRGWSFWNMIIATILEAAGCALYAIHSQNPTNHMAFLIEFATTNIAPCFLAMATVHVFMCHTTSTMPLEDTSSQSRIVNGSSVFIIFQSGVLVLFDLGLYHIGSYLSAEPVDGITGALDRLSHYEQGVKLLSGSHMLQLVCFGLFIIFQAYWSLKSANSGITLSKRLRFGQSHVSAALSMISVLCMYRSACKLSQYTAVEATSVQLVDSRSDFWLSDAAPILLSLVALCSSFSGLEAQPEACIPYAYLPVPDIKVICVDDERTEGPVKA